MKTSKPFLLAILDGFGLNPQKEANAVYHARKPVFDSLLASCPHTTLCTFGPRVGLPEGQMGNSEVGHLNIGGGRIVEQELSRINRAVSENSLEQIAEFVELCNKVKSRENSALHLLGLLSLGGVHSERGHIESLVISALKRGIKNIFIHAITDGRDRPPTASTEELVAFDSFLENKVRPQFPNARVTIATVIGRYYAMDRDKRWERTKRAYDLFTLGHGRNFSSVAEALNTLIAEDQTDEFFEPATISTTSPEGLRPTTIIDGDSLLFCNFRADRMRQIVTSFFADSSWAGFDRSVQPKLSVLCTLTEYDESYPVEVLFRPMVVREHLGEVFAKANLRQLRIAETEKYPHVTYFFNGGVETPCPGEERLLVPSPRDVPTYDFKPEMSAIEITDLLVEKINEQAFDAIILNFANCDMVGHSGNFDATVKAVETVDICLGRVLEAISEKEGIAIVTADHGNADQMIDYDTGEPHTFHTTHPVPLIVVGEELHDLKLRSDGALCDIAPTICELLGLNQPEAMTGRSLIIGKQ